MNYTSTVGKSYIVVACNKVSLALGINKVKERLVFGKFKLLTDIALNNGIFVLNDRRNKRFCENILFVSYSYLNVCFIGVYAERNIRGQSPGGSSPSEEILVSLALYSEFCNSGFFFYILISLSNLVA